MERMHDHNSQPSWDLYERYLPYVATGSSTMSKRPRIKPDEPCYIERGRGCRVWDIDGHEYIDFRNALGPVTLGYCFPAVDDAIRRQLEKGIIFGHPTRLEGEVAELLVHAIPCAEKVRYLKTGGEAVAAGIKVARAATGRDMVLQCGYNGWLNSLARGGSVLPRLRQDVPRGIPLDLARLHRMLPWGELAPWETLFAEAGDRVAVVVIAMDYHAPELAGDFLGAVRRLCTEHGALLMIDEIVTGFRIAVGGLHEYTDVEVDLAVFSKGMANGMPLSALVGRAELLDEMETAPVSSTFAGETLSLAAAKTCIELYHSLDVVGHLAEMGARLQDGLNRLFAEAGYPLRSIGLPHCPILAATEGNPRDDSAEAFRAFFASAYRHGVSLYTLTYPNFSHASADIDEALQRLRHAVEDVSP